VVLDRHEVAALLDDGGPMLLAHLDGAGLVGVDADVDSGRVSLSARDEDDHAVIACALRLLGGGAITTVVVRHDRPTGASADLVATDGETAVALVAGAPDAAAGVVGSSPPPADVTVAVLPAAALDPLVVALAEVDTTDPPDADLEGRAVLDVAEVGPLVALAAAAPDRATRRLTRAGLGPASAAALAAALGAPRTGFEVQAAGGRRVASVAWIADAAGRHWRHVENSGDRGPTLEIEAVTAAELVELVTAVVGAATPTPNGGPSWAR
jgi:hypothetical protein